MYSLSMPLRVFLAGALLIAAIESAAQSQQAPPNRYDLLIRNAHVFDGNGNPWILADVGVTGDRI
ncbi:MAG: D-aminoacylase, partial [Vicinamibacterales bacterium]